MTEKKAMKAMVDSALEGAAPKALLRPYEGETVEYVMASGASRPALVQRVNPSGSIDLAVFPKAEDGRGYKEIHEVKSVLFSDKNKPYTWHWML